MNIPKGESHVRFERDIGWVFWDETGSTFYGPFKDAEATSRALDIYARSYLCDREPTLDEVTEFNRLLKEGKQ